MAEKGMLGLTYFGGSPKWSSLRTFYTVGVHEVERIGE
jgi:hypothetical protein